MSIKASIEDGVLWLRPTGAKPKVKRHRHVWYVDNTRGTYCGSCGKPHPTEGRQS